MSKDGVVVAVLVRGSALRWSKQIIVGWQRSGVVKESSGSGIELEQATQSVATVNGPALRRYVHRGEEEKIAFALVVPFKMMMIDVLGQCAA